MEKPLNKKFTSPSKIYSLSKENSKEDPVDGSKVVINLEDNNLHRINGEDNNLHRINLEDNKVAINLEDNNLHRINGEDNKIKAKVGIREAKRDHNKEAGDKTLNKDKDSKAQEDGALLKLINKVKDGLNLPNLPIHKLEAGELSQTNPLIHRQEAGALNQTNNKDGEDSNNLKLVNKVLNLKLNLETKAGTNSNHKLVAGANNLNSLNKEVREAGESKVEEDGNDRAFFNS